MPVVFHRGLSLPLWAIVFFTVASAASPPPTPVLMGVLGIAVMAVIACTKRGLGPPFGTSRSVVPVAARRPSDF
jgi:hypothetical protein